MFGRLKKKWNIESNKQVLTVLVVFAVTGSTTVYLEKLFFELAGITAETSLWVKIPVYLVVVLVSYNVLLLMSSFILGQFRFFLNFEKKYFPQFMPKKKNSLAVDLKSGL